MPERFEKVAELSELKQNGRLVVKGGRFGVVLFYHQNRIHALDNRCPHLGFPLHMGTVKDGILTCHWHNAQFELCSGGTFDPFADDVPTYPVKVVGNDILLDLQPDRGGQIDRWKRRLQEGMRQNLRLVIAKAVVALVDLGVDTREIVRIGTDFGVNFRAAGWSSGMTILAAMANVMGRLDGEGRIHALYEGLRHVAQDCAGRPPRIKLDPLDNREVSAEKLTEWFRQFIESRNADGAERVLRTAVQNGASPAQLSQMLFLAATDHFYRAGGHVLDFQNKACELLDFIGWEHADEVLPSLVRQLSDSARMEEANVWRSPIDLVTPIREASEQLPDLFREGEGKVWASQESLLDTLLGEDPLQTIAALKAAIRQGATTEALAGVLVRAAGERVARFNTTNEFPDWIQVLHTFSYCNALHQAVRRVNNILLARGLFHGAMAVYFDRFFNVPPARLPWERHAHTTARGGNGAAGHIDADHVAGHAEVGRWLEEFLEALNARGNVEAAADLVYRYREAGGGSEGLIKAFGKALLREDAEFHTFQMLEAGLRQFDLRAQPLNTEAETHSRAPDGELMLMAICRYLASHAPTMREAPHIARTAMRLSRGEALHKGAV